MSPLPVTSPRTRFPRPPAANDGTCTYTFTHAVPAKATGTYAIGIEGRRGLTLLPGTAQQLDHRVRRQQQVIYFSVDGIPVVPRRTVVAIANCNNCHTNLSLHGENRNQIEMCVLCHNPSESDDSHAAQRRGRRRQGAADRKASTSP